MKSKACVRTSLGEIHGHVKDGFVEFKGIRFAKAPVGSLRFKPPQAVNAWQEPLQATAFGPAPVQAFHPAVNHSRQQMDEDCLFLNIWAPSTPGPHPVLVWVHGGGQTFGSTRRPEYDGQAFARSGIVCITVAYRLGVFGFLELGSVLGGDYTGSSNNALRDIEAALQWVQQHVENFGGNPGQVTLGGESAGAKNAAALLAVSGASKLFHQLVVLSGGADTWSSLDDANRVAAKFLDLAGVSKKDPKALLEMSADSLVLAQEALAENWDYRFPWRPVVEGSWMQGSVVGHLRDQSAAAMPLFIGSCRDECAPLVDAGALSLPMEANALAHQTPEAYSALEREYARAYKDLGVLERRIKALTAEEYLIPSVRLATAFAHAGAPVWMSRFDHEAEVLAGPWATHVSDLPFWWNNLSRAAHLSPPDRLLAQAMHDALSRYIHGNQPTAPGTPWPVYELKHRSVLAWSVCPMLVCSPTEQDLKLWGAVNAGPFDWPLEFAEPMRT